MAARPTARPAACRANIRIWPPVRLDAKRLCGTWFEKMARGSRPGSALPVPGAIDARLISDAGQPSSVTTTPARRLDAAKGYADLFALAKDLVEGHLGRSRAGIMLGLQSLGVSDSGFLGGYFVSGSNAIVLNRDVLSYIRTRRPEHHDAYAFHVLLHEYLHTLGYFHEGQVRAIAHEISQDAFGDEHPTTLIAAAMAPGVAAPGAPELFKDLVYAPVGWRPPHAGPIEIVPGFDLDASPYIA